MTEPRTPAHASCTHPATKAARAACRRTQAAERIAGDQVAASTPAPITPAEPTREELEADAIADGAREAAASLPRPGFTQGADRGYAHTAYCRGTHHSDEGKVGRCDACLRPVVRTHRGKLVRYSYADSGAVRFFCFGDEHVCEPEALEAAAATYAAARAAGDLLKGDRVIVVKGRKIAKGTEGTIFWLAPAADQFGVEKIGFRTDGGETIFINRANVQHA